VIGRIATSAGLAAASLLLSFGIVEVTLRHLADADGNLVVRGRLLGRQHLPIVTTRQKIEAYLGGEGRPFLVYDPLLGWAPRPNATSADGLYHYNAQGVRAQSDTARTAPAGTMRIALFGDSYIHGDEVGFEETIGAQLESRLRAAGFDVEVLNFGVSAYGTDQAFLRWRSLGKTFAPEVVIQGLFIANVTRNLNVIRSIKSPRGGIPFSKPRFVLQGETLLPINVPTLPPARVVGVLEDFSSWEYARYEHFFAPCGDVGSFWRRSCALDFLLASVMPRCALSVDWSPSGEPARVTQRILEQYAKEVGEAGAAFFVLQLPEDRRLRRNLLHEQRSDSDELVDAIVAQFEVINPEEALVAAARQADVRALFVERHYTGQTNDLVAAAVAARLRAQLQTRARPRPPSPERMAAALGFARK
jgi:hypothetical protein